MMVSAKRNRRRGTCAWCERQNQKLSYTVYVIDGSYHAACVCQRCLDDYEKRLQWQIHRQWMEVFEDEAD